MESPGTLIVDSNNGETLSLFDSGAFKKISDKNGMWNSFMYTENYEGVGGVTGYFKVDSSVFTSLATMQPALILQGAIIVDNEEYILFDYEPTSYGVMAVGSHFVDGDDQMSSIVQGYSFKTDYDAEDLENITLSNNGILKDDDVLLIDLSSTDSEIDSLLIGRKDMKCAVRFWTINSMSGSLWFGQNIWWDDAGSFISIDSDDANAAAFNVPSRVRLSYTGGIPTSVVGSNESCTTRQCVLDTGANLTGVILSCNTVLKYCEFEVSGWSSYTLGSVPGSDPDPDPDPSSKDDMRLIYNPETCIGEEYVIQVTDKFDSTIPVKNADVTIYLNYNKKAELTTNNEGKVFFTPEQVGSYSLKVDATSDYRAIF
jgi:hypothetical protein